MTDFQFILAWNGSHHGDVIVRLGDLEARCDSYYFALDSAGGVPNAGEEIARRSINGLLREWSRALSSQVDGATVFLPFEFDDEWIGGFRCARGGDHLELTLGNIEENGYAVSPSNLGSLIEDPPSFTSMGFAPLTVEREQFQNQVKRAASEVVS